MRGMLRMLEPNRPAALYTTEADAEETEETVNHLITGEPSKEQLPPFFALSRSNGPGIGNRGRSVDLPPSLSRESHHGVTCCHAPPLSSSRPFFFFKALLPGLDHPEREREREVGRRPDNDCTRLDRFSILPQSSSLAPRCGALTYTD